MSHEYLCCVDAAKKKHDVLMDIKLYHVTRNSQRNTRGYVLYGFHFYLHAAAYQVPGIRMNNIIERIIKV